MSAEPLCTLRDCTFPHADEEGILPPTPGAVHTIAELLEHLHAAAARRPHALRMDLPGEFRAWIHIGGPFGAVRLGRVYLQQPMPANAAGDWIAMPDRPLPVSEYVSFLTDGSTSEDDIGGDQLLPVAEVIPIAAYLAEHRALPATHGWVQYHGNGCCTYVAKAQGSAAQEDASGLAPVAPFCPRGELLRDDASYLKALAASPHDRLLRRLYADWLEALAPRRTELIRVCEAMRDVPVWSDRYWELKTRRNELWENCPLPWLEATGYDGSYYDPIFRDGVPAGCRERWRLLREFTERWHGIPVPDIGGRRAEIREAEARLDMELPPSLQELVAYVHDLGASSPAHDPRGYNTLFHSASFVLYPLHRHAALSLIHFTLSSSTLGVRHEDLGTADPPTYFFDEVLEANGATIPPSASRPDGSPTFFAPTLSLSIFSNLFIQLPTVGNMEARGADADVWLPRLAGDFPIHARFDNAHIFETNELLVLVTRNGTAERCEYLVEAIVRRPIPAATIPAYLFGGTGSNIGSAGLLTPESLRRGPEAGYAQPGRPQPAWCTSIPDPAHFDLKTYMVWRRHAGRYPLWLSILRGRDAERCAKDSSGYLPQGEPPRPETSHVAWDDDIPF